MRGKRVGLRVQAALCSAIYAKALRVDPNEPDFNVGEAVNLMATDARTACRLFTFGHQLWAAPLVTAAAIAGLCLLIGYAAVGGVLVVLASMACTAELTKRVKRRQRAMERVRDDRLALLNECVSAPRGVPGIGARSRNEPIHPFAQRGRGARPRRRVFLVHRTGTSRASASSRSSRWSPRVRPPSARSDDASSST